MKALLGHKIRWDTIEKNNFQLGIYSIHNAYTVRASFKNIECVPESGPLTTWDIERLLDKDETS